MSLKMILFFEEFRNYKPKKTNTNNNDNIPSKADPKPVKNLKMAVPKKYILSTE